MKTNLFIPEQINVGYQNREDTYTKRLAYIVYFDETGKLRKEPSWNSWRDTTIPNDIFENKPTSGFVLNRHAGGGKYGWDKRQSYCRVLDPRGFEIEITIDNLMYILEFTDCSKKSLDGEFVYAWDMAELVLLPCKSPDYESIKTFTNKVVASNLKAKDLVVGGEYLSKDNNTYIYIGKYDYYGPGYVYLDSNNEVVYTKNEKEVPFEEGSKVNRVYYSYRPIKYGRYHWFAVKNENNLYSHFGFYAYRTLPKSMIECVRNKTDANMGKLLEAVTKSDGFAPRDDSKTKLEKHTLDSFMEALNKSKGYTMAFFSKKGFSYDVRNIRGDNYSISISRHPVNYVLRDSGEFREGRDLEAHFKEYAEKFNGKVHKRSMLNTAYLSYRDYEYEADTFSASDLYFRLEPCFVTTYFKTGKIYGIYGCRN